MTSSILPVVVYGTLRPEADASWSGDWDDSIPSEDVVIENYSLFNVPNTFYPSVRAENGFEVKGHLLRLDLVDQEIAEKTLRRFDQIEGCDREVTEGNLFNVSKANCKLSNGQQIVAELYVHYKASEFDENHRITSGDWLNR